MGVANIQVSETPLVLYTLRRADVKSRTFAVDLLCLFHGGSVAMSPATSLCAEGDTWNQRNPQQTHEQDAGGVSHARGWCNDVAGYAHGIPVEYHRRPSVEAP